MFYGICIFQTGNLEHLDLSRNPLKALPVEVGNLELLQELGQWEVGISFLSRLQHLDVSRCLLTEWPPQINLLVELTHLDLSHNEITVIPAELGELVGLQTLLLSHNGIDDLTADIYLLQRLQVLDLSHNRIAALPHLPPSNLSSDPEERRLECLIDLDLSHNSLTVLDEMLSMFTGLETFNASHNQIYGFEGDPLAKLTALRVLDLSHNELPGLSPGLRFCASLQHLRVAHNKLSSVPEALSRTTKLVSIDLSHNEITEATGKIFAMLNDLRKVELQHNRIAALPALLFSLRHLQHLDCSYNDLTEIPEVLGTLTGVNYLNFANNQIVSIPDSVSNLTSLKALELASNCITALPSSISKLYRTLAKVTMSRNNLKVSPNLLVTLPMLLSCNLSWNPNLKAHFVDWAKLSVDYKPKKAFISPEILTRRIATVVDRLDLLIAEAKPPPSPESYYLSGEQAKATAGAEPVDEELLEFQTAVEDGSNPEQAARSAAARKEAKKRLAKGVKKVKQVLAWQILLREHILNFSRRAEDSPPMAPTNTDAPVKPIVTTSVPAAVPMPVIGDVAEAQKERLVAHMHSLFKHLDKNRGGAPIGMSWQDALLCTEVDLLEDSACGSLLQGGSMSLGAEFQDSIESLQYLINEVDALMMLQELRYRLDQYARVMGRLQAQQKEVKAFDAVSPTVKSKMTALSGAAKKFVKTANAGGNLVGRDEHSDPQHHDPNSDFSGTTIRSSNLGLSGPASQSLVGRDRSEDPGWLSKETSTIYEDAKAHQSLEEQLDPGVDAEVRSEHAQADTADALSPDRTSMVVPRSPEQNAEEDENEESDFGVSASELPQLPKAKNVVPLPEEDQIGFEASAKLGGNRKEAAEDHLDLLTRNIRVSVKVRRDNQKLAEEAAKLARSIADTLDQVQKPSLGIVYTRLPHLAFLPVAVEGVLPGTGLNAGVTAQNEALLPIMVDCCLQLCKALLLRADSLRDAVRELEIRGGIPVSSLDVSQRCGEDFLDLMEDVHEDLSRAIDLKESESGAAGGPKKSRSIFGKKNSASSSSALLEAAMAGPSTLEDDGDGTDAEGGEEEDGTKQDGDEIASVGKSEATGAMTRQGSSATITSATAPPVLQKQPTEAPLAPLSSILPRPDPGRVVKHPVDTVPARRCIKLLSGHRTLTLMWTSYLLEAISGMLARRGTDPQYQKFRTHTRNSYNPTPEWVTQVTGRLSQMKGRVYQGLCIYYRAIDEFAVCTKFSKNARSRPYYVSILKLHLAQGNFMWARSVLHDALRGLYPKSFPGFDLNDSTAMPDPIDVLRVDKELALLQAFLDVNMGQLDSCGLFTSTHSRFCSVQENGLLSAPERVPVENARGLTLHAITVIKDRQSSSGNEAARRREKEDRESSREELKQLIREAREKALYSLSIPQ